MFTSKPILTPGQQFLTTLRADLSSVKKAELSEFLKSPTLSSEDGMTIIDFYRLQYLKLTYDNLLLQYVEKQNSKASSNDHSKIFFAIKSKLELFNNLSYQSKIGFLSLAEIDRHFQQLCEVTKEYKAHCVSSKRNQKLVIIENLETKLSLKLNDASDLGQYYEAELKSTDDFLNLFEPTMTFPQPRDSEDSDDETEEEIKSLSHSVPVKKEGAFTVSEALSKPAANKWFNRIADWTLGFLFFGWAWNYWHYGLNKMLFTSGPSQGDLYVGQARKLLTSIKNKEKEAIVFVENLSREEEYQQLLKKLPEIINVFLRSRNPKLGFIVESGELKADALLTPADSLAFEEFKKFVDLHKLLPDTVANTLLSQICIIFLDENPNEKKNIILVSILNQALEILDDADPYSGFKKPRELDYTSLRVYLNYKKTLIDRKLGSSNIVKESNSSLGAMNHSVTFISSSPSPSPSKDVTPANAHHPSIPSLR